MPSGDKAPFLFDESRRENLPAGGEVAEMNTTKALAAMAWLFSENKPAMQIGGKPHAAQIGDAVAVMPKKAFGADTKGFEAFHKKMGKALKLFSAENERLACFAAPPVGGLLVSLRECCTH